MLALTDEDDLALAHELAARADVLIENMRPGGMLRFGLDHDTVRAGNPGIGYASISGFGTTEQAASLAGYDLMVQGISGLMSLTGDPDGPAYRAGMPVCDVLAGLHATVGILAALNRRHETGVGQRIEVDLLSSTLSGLVNHTSAVVASDVTPFRMGNAHPSLFPYEPLPTADGEILVIAGNDRQFAELCEVLGLLGVARDERFATNEDRTAQRAALLTLLLEALATRTTAEWFDLLRANGLPGGPVNTVREGVAFAASVGLHPVIEAGDGDAAVPSIRNPITLSDSPRPTATRRPGSGSTRTSCPPGSRRPGD